MGLSGGYGWVAEKKRAAMAEKLARRGMPSYAQRPVSERYGTSYTGAGPDGEVDRSAPAGFDMTTDPPHVYHEGELQVSAPEGKVYLNADIAPAADPGAVREYEDARGNEDMNMLELAALGPRKDAKKRFEGTQTRGKTTASSGGGFLGFRAGGGIVAGMRVPRAAGNALEAMDRSGLYRRFESGGWAQQTNNWAPTVPSGPSQPTRTPAPASVKNAANTIQNTINAQNNMRTASVKNAANTIQKTINAPTVTNDTPVIRNDSPPASDPKPKSYSLPVPDPPPPAFNQYDQNQKYQDMAKEPMDGGMFMQNPYTQNRLDQMGREGVSQQAYLRHQQAMRGTDANAAWAQGMMQRAATEEGMNGFAAQASADDWNNMQRLASEWLKNDDPALRAQAARVYNYMMPGSGVDFSGVIASAGARKFNDAMGQAQVWAASGQSKQDIINAYKSAYRDEFPDDVYTAWADNAINGELGVAKNQLRNSAWYNDPNTPPDDKLAAEVLLEEMHFGKDIDGDGYIGDKAYGLKAGGGEAGGAGGETDYGYESNVSKVDDVEALKLASVPVKDKDGNPLELPPEVARKRKVLINDISKAVYTDGRPPELSMAQAIELYRGTPLWDDLLDAWEKNGVARNFNTSQNNLDDGKDKYYNNRLFRIGDDLYQYTEGSNKSGFKMVNVRNPSDVKLVDGYGQPFKRPGINEQFKKWWTVSSGGGC